MADDETGTALSHKYWKKTFAHIAGRPEDNPMAASVAEIALVLLEGSKHNETLIDYLNQRAAKALEGKNQ